MGQVNIDELGDGITSSSTSNYAAAGNSAYLHYLLATGTLHSLSSTIHRSR
jgi:hypothetical protein